MRALPALVCLIAALPALPQSVLYSVSQRREDWRSLAKVKHEASFRGLVVVLEDGKPNLSEAMKKAIASDDRLFDLNLRVITLGPGTCAPQLRLQEGWNDAPRWALLDREGRAVVSGTEAPTTDALWKAFEASGLPTWKGMLEDFLRENPGQGDARYYLLAQHFRLAARRMKGHLVTPPPTPENPEPSPTLKAPLTWEEDARIWGEAASTLESLLESEGWMGGDALLADRLVHPLALHSPLMQEVARKGLPKVEAVLRAHPAHTKVWQLWLGLGEVSGQLDRLPALVDELEPVPGTLRFPPEDVTARLAERLREKCDWAGLIKVLEPAWTHWLASSFEVQGDAAMQAQTALQPWETGAAPLVEACLRAGNVARAEAVVKEALAWSGSPRYPEQAAALAKRLDQPALADRWAKLSVPDARTRPTTRGGSLESLARDAWRKPFWVVLEDDAGKAERAFLKAAENEALGDHLLPIHTVGPKSHPDLARTLASRLGMPTGWLLVGEGGRVLGEGAGTPEPLTLRDALDAARVQPRVQVLEAFVKAHPGHANALQVLLGQHLMLAERRMRPHLKPQEKDRDWHDREPLELRAPLTEAEDGRIWGPSAALLQRLFQEEAFRLRGLDGLASLPPDAVHSPRMQAAARKALPALEAWMTRERCDWVHWRFWSTLNSWIGHSRSAMDLMARCPQAPGRRPYVPSDTVVAFNRDARVHKDWTGLQAFLEPLWFQVSDLIRPAPEDSENGQWNTTNTWEQMGPLVEAHLRLKADAKATTLVKEMVERTGTTALARKAAALAASCQRSDLAASWSALRPAKPAEDTTLRMGR